jgi:5-hydroxyisourate hydrolase
MISTHVLDTALGRPAAGVPVVLERLTEGDRAIVVSSAVTDADGRVRELIPSGTPLAAGTYRLIFETGVYFNAAGVEVFYPHVPVVFTVHDAKQHHHVPLLLSPYGYSTYRGS